MPWRAAADDDFSWIGTFLRAHVQSSMFLLSNLHDHGLGADAPYGLSLWAREGGAPGVFGITNSGMAMMQAPGATAADWRAAADLIAGRTLSGCAGETGQVRAFLAATGLSRRPARLNEDEPGFALELDRLILPDTQAAELLPLSAAPPDLVTGWRAAYHAEVLGAGPQDCAEEAARDVAAYLERDSHRVLSIAGAPVAMCGFNAQVPDVVQVGGVYTPPELRGRGFARTAVALHLCEARTAGAMRAVLFAASAAAAKAYTAIGFRPAGSFSLVLFAPGKEMS